jgi:hypothetical protein
MASDLALLEETAFTRRLLHSVSLIKGGSSFNKPPSHQRLQDMGSEVTTVEHLIARLAVACPQSKQCQALLAQSLRIEQGSNQNLPVSNEHTTGRKSVLFSATPLLPDGDDLDSDDEGVSEEEQKSRNDAREARAVEAAASRLELLASLFFPKGWDDQTLRVAETPNRNIFIKPQLKPSFSRLRGHSHAKDTVAPRYRAGPHLCSCKERAQTAGTSTTPWLAEWR